MKPSRAIQRSHERTATSARARDAGLFRRRRQVALVGAQVLVAEVGQLEGVAARVQEDDELLELGVIGSDRVRAAVRLELKPADVFVRRGLQIDGHDEAGCMLTQMPPVTGGSPKRSFQLWESGGGFVPLTF